MTIAIEISIPQMTSSQVSLITIAGEVRASGSASAIEAGWGWAVTQPLHGHGNHSTEMVPSQGVSVRRRRSRASNPFSRP